MQQHDRLSADRSINNPFAMFQRFLSDLEKAYSGEEFNEKVRKIVGDLSPEHKNPVLPSDETGNEGK